MREKLIDIIMSLDDARLSTIIRSLWRFLVCVNQNGGIIPAVLFFAQKNRAKSTDESTPLLQNIAVFSQISTIKLTNCGREYVSLPHLFVTII